MIEEVIERLEWRCLVKMNIVINAVISYDKPRGVGRYFNNLLPALAKIDKDNQYFVYYGKWMNSYGFLKIQQKNFHFIELDIYNNKLMRNLYLAFVLPLKATKYKPDIYHLIDSSPTIIKTCRTISAIHDLAEFEVPEKYSKIQSVLRKLYVRLQIKISDMIITVSEYSKNDIRKRFGVAESNIMVVPNALTSAIKISQRSLPKNYLLFVGEIERTKNLGCLIEAFDLLPEDIKIKFLIHVVGKKGNDYKNVIHTIKRTHLENKVVMHGYVSDEELIKLYSEAYAFVFPSKFEGFGLPVLEAMGSGIPVICSDKTSIPEVGGNAVLTFNSDKPEELATMIFKIINIPSLREEMIIKGITRSKKFTTYNCAKLTLELYKKAVKL